MAVPERCPEPPNRCKLRTWAAPPKTTAMCSRCRCSARAVISRAEACRTACTRPASIRMLPAKHGDKSRACGVEAQVSESTPDNAVPPSQPCWASLWPPLSSGVCGRWPEARRTHPRRWRSPRQPPHQRRSPSPRFLSSQTRPPPERSASPSRCARVRRRCLRPASGHSRRRPPVAWRRLPPKTPPRSPPPRQSAARPGAQPFRCPQLRPHPASLCPTPVPRGLRLDRLRLLHLGVPPSPALHRRSSSGARLPLQGALPQGWPRCASCRRATEIALL